MRIYLPDGLPVLQDPVPPLTSDGSFYPSRQVLCKCAKEALFARRSRHDVFGPI
jgi:hypothetical protein